MRIIGESFILNVYNSFFSASSYLENKVRNIVAECFKLLKMNGENPAKPLPKVTFKGNDDINANKSVYVFGDIHGELNGFWENLLNAGLIDNDKKWVGKSCVMVQMGDVIDRGIMSEEAWDYLKELQAQAEKTSGTVVRLTGNHELMVLEGNFHYANRVIKNPEKFAEKVKAEILNGNARLAYTDGKRLYTHAGLRSKIRELIISEIMAKQQNGNNQVFVEDIVDHLNGILVKAVENNDFSHPIFQVGHSRGGNHSHGGVLWEDVSEMLSSKNARDIPQVIGHNPPRYRGESPIRVTESKRLVNVDAGLNHLYGGHRAYVVFEGSDIIVKNKVAGIWTETKIKNI
jgi:hypothetical protein